MPRNPTLKAGRAPRSTMTGAASLGIRRVISVRLPRHIATEESYVCTARPGNTPAFVRETPSNVAAIKAG
jgi:hypothetical protein